jgi:DNA repair exonuclease SbcCD ATPase subunit
MTALEGLAVELARQEKLFERRMGEARSVAQNVKTYRAEIAELTEREESLDEAIGVLNSYADSRQADIQTKIETLVTHGLRTIFGEDLSFHIKQTMRGKRMEADFVVRSKMGRSVVETPILDARGGGVAAVAGFLLRLVILLLRKGDRAVLFLDESFAQLSAEYEPALAQVLQELVEKTRVQIVMVTHSSAYDEVADVSYRLHAEKGATKVERLS